MRTDAPIRSARLARVGGGAPLNAIVMRPHNRPPVLIRYVQESELPELLALVKAKAEFDGVASTMVATVETLRHAL